MAEEVCPAKFADLILVVGQKTGKQRSFHVIKTTLCMHSKAFDRMLKGAWIEGGLKSVQLPEDDPDAFAMLLEILYHKISGHSPCKQKADLVPLTELAEKYDFVPLIRKCVGAWVLNMDEGDIVEFAPEELCFLGWTLGLKQVFEIGWRRLVIGLNLFEEEMWVERSVNGDCVYDEPVEIDRLYHGAIGIRSTIVNDMTEFVTDTNADELAVQASDRMLELHRTMQSFANDLVHGRHKSRHKNERECHLLVVGATMDLLRMDLIPLILDEPAVGKADRPQLSNCSVQERSDQLLLGWRGLGLGNHRDCVPNTEWRKRIQAVMDWQPTLTFSQKKHLTRFDS